MARGGAGARPGVPGHHRPLGLARLRQPRHARRAARQIEHVREVNAGLEGFELLIGTETNIVPDGAPDYDDDCWPSWTGSSARSTRPSGSRSDDDDARMVAAVEHPLIDASATPPAARSRRRAPYAVDIDAVIDAAARTGTMLEINAAPDRRDLNDLHARAAAAAGVRDPHQHRRPQALGLRPAAVGRGHGPAGVADRRRRGQHAALGAVRAAAQARRRRLGRRRAEQRGQQLVEDE